ncbi:DUF2723 domain-containing protein [Sphingobacterium alkalisoli]|uniref:DUF2723 domain-containing protein n=1 Tax=Sphingobacterium alkalisoli TaxID=1874115 RepID=A0A4U0H8A6_9SPHI|nr:DUF2723 domain-containing protein [Sphingobacterium alkalisoli]TJY68087.1 DUF2723 domain-containing protein [Sphingobacterium alkalisoli]GGH09158.1 membrane protein [Sphingobacterium alkalisoli]
MKYAKINNIVGWLCGAIAATVYIITAEKFNSWWDTGEFIASAYKLQIVHQPGAPLFLMLQNLFSNFAFGDTSRIALLMNIGSAICSGLTIVFLFWTTTALARKIMDKAGEGGNLRILQIIGAGTVGALAYGFTDTFWYSAVESEVYAMSSLCTAIVFWLVLKWERRADQPDANRWLLMIAYVMGLSIGVHLLNLLTIPALALVVYLRKTKQITWKGVAKSLGIGILILAFILWGLIQYMVKSAAYVDLFFVNTLGLPFGFGVVSFMILILGSLIFGIIYSVRRVMPILNVLLLGICFVLVGFSSYSMLLIRAQTNISLNNNDPDNVFSFLGYLSREQYASEPLLKGPNFDAKVKEAHTQHTYRKDESGYTKIESNRKYTYDKESLFPRMYSEKHAAYYQHYLNLNADQSPTFLDNLSFFFSYQLNDMYIRYFMWNFVGRQNDKQGHGTYTEGNWLSGIDFLDNARLGGQEALSPSMKSDPSRNNYFFLPLLLGVLGLIWQIKHRKQDALIVALLFFFTGIAIVIYLNQTPMQPRERDYAYAGSFYVFSIWIGLGLLGLIDIIKQKIMLKSASILSLAICLIAGPGILIIENWDDHNRAEREMTREVAFNYLTSCEPHAILFTYADNDTFPLWYLQEVEGIRTDVRIVNLSYLQSDWYVKQSMQDINEAKRLPLNFEVSKIAKGVRDGLPLLDMNIEAHTDVRTLVDIMLSDNRNNQIQMKDGHYVNFLPTKKLGLPIDKDSVIRNKVVPQDWEKAIPDHIEWIYNKDYVTRAELCMMEILANNNWERPIYFGMMCPEESFMGLDKYLVSEGFVYRLMPVELNQIADDNTLINSDTLHRNITQKYKWGNIHELDHFDPDSNFMYENFILSNVFVNSLTSLMTENKLDKAKEVALIAYDNMPKKVSSLRQVYLNSVIVDTLYETSELDKARLLTDKNLRFVEEEMNYNYAVMQGKNSALDERGVRLGLASLENYQKILSDADDEELLIVATALNDKYKNIYLQ